MVIIQKQQGKGSIVLDVKRFWFFQSSGLTSYKRAAKPAFNT